MSPSVAIIGAGYAGLTAAISLAERGLAITLFDSAAQVGGRARVMERRNPPLDCGQHILLGAYENVLEVMTKVGSDPQSALHRYPLRLLVPGVLDFAVANSRAPWHIFAAFMTTKGLSLRQRWSLLQLARAVLTDDKSITVGQWLECLQQDPFMRRHLWDPLCVSALNTAPQEADARVLVKMLRDSLFAKNARHSDLLLPAVGLDQLFPAPAAVWLGRQGVEINLGHRVLAVTLLPDDKLLLQGEGWQRSFSHLVLAVAPWDLARLTAHLPLSRTTEQARALGSCGIVTGFFRYAAPPAFPFPMIGLSGANSQTSPQPHWAFDLTCLRQWSGWVAMVASAAETIPDVADWDQILRHHLPTLPPLQDHTFHLSRRATFSCIPNQQRPSCETEHARIFLCGDYTVPQYSGTLESAVRSGREAARLLLSSLA